jgi:hypothetical protein
MKDACKVLDTYKQARESIVTDSDGIYIIVEG